MWSGPYTNYMTGKLNTTRYAMHWKCQAAVMQYGRGTQQWNFWNKLWLKCILSHFWFLLALSKRKRHQAQYFVNIEVKLENSTPGNMRRWEMTPSAPLWPVVAGAGRGPPGVQWMQWPATLQHSTISDRRPFKPAQSAQAAPSPP